jgi:DNA modification methylase
VLVDLHTGHVLDVLRNMPDESAHCVVTSPPYWGLRDYGLESVVWRGHRNCNLVEHCWDVPIPGSNRGGSGTPTDKNNRGEGGLARLTGTRTKSKFVRRAPGGRVPRGAPGPAK